MTNNVVQIQSGERFIVEVDKSEPVVVEYISKSEFSIQQQTTTATKTDTSQLINSNQ
jgi:hypothetical protein